MLEAEDKSVPWQRVLWLKQPQYPDNYLDDSFLENLQRNVNVRKYTYVGLLGDTLPVTQHICSVTVFAGVFTHVYDGRLPDITLLGCVLATSVLGYTWWQRLYPAPPPRLSVFKSAMAVSGILLLITPVLQTLTKATTSDSIWPLSGSLFALNSILAEYGAGKSDTDSLVQFPASLSVNAAICASAVLSSRLSSYLAVFTLMLFSIEWFALFPLLRKEIRRSASHDVNIGMTIGLFLLALVLLWPLSPSVALLYTVAMFSLQFLIPFWLLDLQSLKNELRGPWDAAVPQISGSIVSF